MSKLQSIYLDYAAATPIDPVVVKAMRPYWAKKFYNPSATYLAARDVRQTIETARAKVSHWFGARNNEIVFTAGGTEANNLAIHGIMRQFPGGNVIIGAIEHPSVVEPARGYEHKLAPVNPEGIIDIDELVKLIDDRTVLISVMYANNEIGTIQPLHRIAKALNSIRNERQLRGNSRPLYFHTDACQAAAYLDLHVSRLGVDLMTVNGGKIYGPKQSGALYIRSGVQLKPLINGGGQERDMRSGTENVAGIVGLATALDLVQARRAEESLRLKKLQQIFLELLTAKLPNVRINGSLQSRLPNNVHATFPGQDNERLIMELDEEGILCAAGSACSAAKNQASAVLAAIGLNERMARASLRFTMGQTTTADKLRRTVKVLAQLIS